MDGFFSDYVITQGNLVFECRCESSPECLASPRNPLPEDGRDYFLFVAELVWFLPDGSSIELIHNYEYAVAQQHFFTDPDSTISYIFRPYSLFLPIDVIEFSSDGVSSFLQHVVLEHHNMNSRVLCFRIQVTGPFPHHNVLEDDDHDNDDGLISRVMRDSAMEVRMVPTSRAAIEGLEEVSDDINSTCTICMQDLVSSDIDDSDKVLKMPCQHLYHKNCIVRWLETSHFCPMCRYAMPT